MGCLIRNANADTSEIYFNKYQKEFWFSMANYHRQLAQQTLTDA
jgi:hypothetical protein